MMSRALAQQIHAVKCQLFSGPNQATPMPNSQPLSSHRGAIAAQPTRRCLGTVYTAPGHPSSFGSSSSVSAVQRPCRPPRRHVAAAAQAGRGGKGNGGTDEEPDWEAEMSIFKQRISRPNQLATLRELEAKVSVGKVLYARDGLAIVSGLNTDAPLGTKVSFVTGTAGVLLWHRSDNLSFCLVLGDPSTVTEGTPVECKIKGVLQVVDDVKGPITRKDFETFNVPAGEDVFGRVCDHIGRHLPEYDDPVPLPSTASRSPTSSTSGSSSSTGGGSGSGGGSSSSRFRPLVNQQVDMKNREQISESLLTGVKALDILTPFGRGASLLVIGPGGSGKTRLALDTIAGQARWGTTSASSVATVPTPPGGAVRCVLALMGRTKEEVQGVVSELRASGSLSNTAVVAVDAGAPLGHQYAAMCCACSIGERVRDEGGHSLVLVDDIRPLSDVWEQLLGGLVGLGPALLREGLVKDERGRDMPVVAPPGPTGSTAAAADGTSATGGAAPPISSSNAPATASSSPSSSTAAVGPGTQGAGGAASVIRGVSVSDSLSDDEGALVEYEGMLVSGAMAQRRGFLSTFFMRAAKMSRANGGGSMSLMPLVPGTCATGVSKRIDMSKYKTLSPEQLAKLEAALRAKMLAEELAAAGSGELATEVVEEFISIADGQVVLEGPQQRQQQQQQQQQEGVAYLVNPKLSITRIGTRAYYKALEQLAPQVRLYLAQADDARRFGGAAASTSSVASGSSVDLAFSSGGARLSAADLRADALARRLSAALLQPAGRPASLAEQVAALFVVQRGFADSVPVEHLPRWLQEVLGHLAVAAPAAMQEVGRTGILTADAEAAMSAALDSFQSS